MTKAELRKLYLSKRVRLSDDEYRNACDSICSNFFRAIDLGNVKVLHSYLTIAKNKEPDTILIIQQVQARYPDVRISVPKINTDDTLTSYFYEGKKQLADSDWGILEPTGGTVTDPLDIDLIIVPLLAFDKHGHRVGYGKGFYDRFLQSCRPDSLKVGLSLFPAEDKIDDIAEFDQPLSLTVTPETAYRF